MRSKRWLIAFVAVLALLVASVGVAVAITNGEPACNSRGPCGPPASS